MPHGLSRARASALAVLLYVTGCGASDALLSPSAQAPSADRTVPITLQVSSLAPAAGTRLTLAIAVAPATAPHVGALQGGLHFDPTALRYLGQIATSDGLALVSDSLAANGELHLVAIAPSGLAPRVAVMVFDVLASSIGAVRLDVEVAASPEGELLPSQVADAVELATDLPSTAAFRRMTLSEQAIQWQAAIKAALVPATVQSGSLLFGDVDQDGKLSALDLVAAANLASGSMSLLPGSSPWTQPAFIAANVWPPNLPGLGEAGDAVPPGVESGGGRWINALDVLAIARKLVGYPVSIVGEYVPASYTAPSQSVGHESPTWGLSPKMDQPFSSDLPYPSAILSAASGRWYAFPGMINGINSDGTLSRVQDATAPASPPSVLRVTFATGHTAGNAPVTFAGWGPDYSSAPSTNIYRELYVSMWIRIGDGNGFENHPVGTKLAYLGIGDDPTNATREGYLLWENPAHSQSVQTLGSLVFVTQNVVGRRFAANTGDNTMRTGVWHQIEFHGRQNSAPDGADGVFELWLDGQQTHRYTDVVWRTAASPYGFSGWKGDPVWGGYSGPVKTRTDYLYYDHVYVSGK